LADFFTWVEISVKLSIKPKSITELP